MGKTKEDSFNKNEGFMNIIKMTISDYEEAYKLWTNTEGMGLRSLDDSKEGIYKFLKRNQNTNYICRDKNKLVGVILCGNDGRRGYIYHTLVHPNYRMKGIGKQLVKNVILSLEKENINKVALVVYANNTKGNAFWKNLNFIKRDDLTYRNYTINNNNI